MSSVWKNVSKLPEFDRLERDVNTDVLIIGGGLAGLLCAYRLKQEGIDCLLAERRRICGGVTGNTTAKITSQHGLIYDKLIREFNVEKAALYLRANEEALQNYRGLCSKIDCDFETKDNYVYSLDDSAALDREIAALGRIGCQAQRVNSVPLPFHVAGAVKFENQAQFNPLAFAADIAKGLKIYENTDVRQVKDGVALTGQARISARSIIVAAHFPFINKHGAYFIKMYQHRSYVIALEQVPQIDGMYVDDALTGLSFRNYKDMLLIGGGDHRTGKPGGGWEELRSFAAENYPGASERYHWAAQDCMTLDGAAYIGRYSPNTENLYVATGFNKWGMTTSMAAAMLLSDMIQGKSNPYQDVFSPSRSVLRPQLAANAVHALAGLLAPSAKRCPHMGCALKWNPIERTWDCPCHGSRFGEDGRLIDDPATADIERRCKDG